MRRTKKLYTLESCLEQTIISSTFWQEANLNFKQLYNYTVYLIVRRIRPSHHHFIALIILFQIFHLTKKIHEKCHIKWFD